MINTQHSFPVIDAIVLRHAEDAAFYWGQIDRSNYSPRLTFERLKHFERIRNAHLSGLEAAESIGLQSAMRALERWRKPGDVFVCTWTAIRQNNREVLYRISELVCKYPDTLIRGVISALATLPIEAQLQLKEWSTEKASPIMQVAALRAALLLGESSVRSLSLPVTFYLDSECFHVRAAACRVSVLDNPDHVIPALKRLLDDPTLQVRGEAALALAYLGEEPLSLASLGDSVLAQATMKEGMSGFYRHLASRRLGRWVRLFASFCPIGDARIFELIERLPTRDALHFVVSHGDANYLGFIVSQMRDAHVQRYAGWCWQTMTGIDLISAGLTLPNDETSKKSSTSPISDESIDLDNNLPIPNAMALEALAFNFSSSKQPSRTLFGEEIGFQHALKLLNVAPQAVRVIAAQTFNSSESPVIINVRSACHAQLRAMQALSLA